MMPLDRQILDNTWVTVLARLAMLATPVLLAVLGIVLSDAIGARDSRMATLEQRVSTDEARTVSIEVRLTTIETDQKHDGIDTVNLRSDLLAQLSTVARGQIDMVSKLSALEATVQALKEQVGRIGAAGPTMRPGL